MTHSIDTNHTESNYPLASLGWNSFFQSRLDAMGLDASTDTIPVRVTGVHKDSFQVSDGNGEWLATIAGKLRHDADALYPVTGDWAFVRDTVITLVMPRKNALSRGASGSRDRKKRGKVEEQFIAANLDTVFIVCGLDRDFNVRRIERYLTLVYNCALNPVVILTKADLQDDPQSCVEETEAVAFGVPVHLVSANNDDCLLPLEEYLSEGQTVCMVGSSGAGKSTLLNRLSGNEVQVTSAVSQSVGKGRHTTTTRDLIRMPQGGVMVDNPGIREIAFSESGDGISSSFADIEEYAAECRFSDCTHMHEPGCRVIQAVESGELPQERLNSYHKMQRELSYLEDRKHKSADRIEKERWKYVALKIKDLKKRRK